MMDVTRSPNQPRQPGDPGPLQHCGPSQTLRTAPAFALAAVFVILAGVSSAETINFTDNLTIEGDDGDPQTFKGIPFNASIVGGVAEFRFPTTERISFDSDDIVICPASFPMSIRAADMIVDDAVFECNFGRGGGGAGGLGGGGGAAGAGGNGATVSAQGFGSGGAGGPAGGAGINDPGINGQPGGSGNPGEVCCAGSAGGAGGMGSAGEAGFGNASSTTPTELPGSGGMGGSNITGQAIAGVVGCGGGVAGCNAVNGGNGGNGEIGPTGDSGSDGGDGADTALVGTNGRTGPVLSAGNGGPGGTGGGGGGGAAGGQSGAGGSGGGSARGGFFVAGSVGGTGGIAGGGASGCAGRNGRGGPSGGNGGGAIELLSLSPMFVSGTFNVVPEPRRFGESGFASDICQNNRGGGAFGTLGGTAGNGTGGAGGNGGAGGFGGDGGNGGGSGDSGSGAGGTVLLRAPVLDTSGVFVNASTSPPGGEGRVVVSNFFLPRFAGGFSGARVEEFEGLTGPNPFIAGDTLDDSGTTPGDGCDGTCQVESARSFAGEPSVSGSTCGDGIVTGAETCDDSGTTAGDGCDASCEVEAGFSCVGEPSVCTFEVCGDGVISVSETCDDSGTTPGDGCDASCQIESGYSCVGEPSVCSESGGSFPNTPYENFLVGGPGRYGTTSGATDPEFNRDSFPESVIAPVGRPFATLAVHRPTTAELQSTAYSEGFPGFEPIVLINLCASMSVFEPSFRVNVATDLSPLRLRRDPPSQNRLLDPSAPDQLAVTPMPSLGARDIWLTYSRDVDNLRVSFGQQASDGSGTLQVLQQDLARGATLYLEDTTLAVPCPEPTTSALAAVSVAVLALLRRRRSVDG